MAELRVKGTGTIKLFESDNTSSVTIASPASLSADKTITLPDADVTLASGTMLATDGSGASLTALNASELGSGTVPTARLGSGSASSSVFLSGASTWIAAGGGKINQVVTTGNKDDFTSTTMSSWLDTGLNVTITPSATDSKIYVQASIGNLYNTTTNYSATVSILQPVADDDANCTFSTADFAAQGPSAANGTNRTFTWGGIDSPSTTSAITYGVMVKGETGGGTLGFNDTAVGGADPYNCITCWEILA